MQSRDRQERYRQRYAEMRSGWRPSTHVYQDLVARHLTAETCVLDLGCGRGGVLERLHSRASFVAGLDPDWRSLREHRAPAIALSCGVAGALPYVDGAFDLVCCSWVLEHLAEPGRAFAEVARVLRIGGHFVFLTPNVRHPLVMLNWALGWTRGQLVNRLYDRREPDIFPACYRASSAIRIERLAQSAGMERVSLQFIGDPTYLALSESMFRLARLLEQATPPRMRVHLVGEYSVRSTHHVPRPRTP
jgi:SAM-dependent methyltransferase